MSIIEVESDWRETGILCSVPGCGWMTYSDGKHRPTCGNPKCLAHPTDEQIYEYLITEKREDEALRQRNEATH